MNTIEKIKQLAPWIMVFLGCGAVAIGGLMAEIQNRRDHRAFDARCDQEEHAARASGRPLFPRNRIL